MVCFHFFVIFPAGQGLFLQFQVKGVKSYLSESVNFSLSFTKGTRWLNQHVVNIPIPLYSNNEKIYDEIKKHVKEIIQTKQQSPAADTTVLERRIDELVFKLYDLTYDEVKIVCPDFWLSREEYEKING